MTTRNKTRFKQFSYLGLSLWTIAFTLQANANPPHYFDEREPSNSFFSKRDIATEMEKKPELLFEKYGVSSEDQMQKDLKKPPMDAQERRYSALKDYIISKYEKERPELARFRNSHRPHYRGPTLQETARDFEQATADVHRKKKQHYKEVTAEAAAWRETLIGLLYVPIKLLTKEEQDRGQPTSKKSQSSMPFADEKK